MIWFFRSSFNSSILQNSHTFSLEFTNDPYDQAIIQNSSNAKSYFSQLEIFKWNFRQQIVWKILDCIILDFIHAA